MSRAKIAVIGSSGQVARALQRAAARHGLDLVAGGRPDVDITSLDSLAAFVAFAGPSIVVNAAAYTAVDKAEGEPDAAFSANARGPILLATILNHLRIPLIHLSTDYVFDGTGTKPYLETDPIHPIGSYGASKAAGETGIRIASPEHIILRTAWVYAPDGNNFVKTMLRLGAERDVVRVVADQRGSPTSADDIADAILAIASRIDGSNAQGLWGTYHLTGSGETTWHDFAAEIFRLAASKGAKTPRLEAITTAQWRTDPQNAGKAHRPAYSVLDNSKLERTFGIRLPPWQEAVARVIDQLVTPAEVKQS